jgi:release factor glutamine methyltransferase
MTDNQVFAFLTRFAPARDVKIIMKNKKVGPLNILSIAHQLHRGVPIAKIIRKKWFYGLPFITNKHTLDPRPDSETLVDAVLKNEKPNRILDLGTGTGNLLCAILKNKPNAAGVGVDRSRRACRIARRNAKELGLGDRVKIIHSSFKRIAKNHQAAGFDLIISNPPYIPTGDPNVNVGAKHDPKIALYGGDDGLKFYREIARIKSGGKLYIEIGIGEMRAVKKIFVREGWRLIKKYRDLSGRVRVLAFATRDA